MQEYDLRSSDWHVLDAFDSQSDFGFQGLKRKLGIHQETLSRALHRLEDDELIQRTPDGYRLTDRGFAVAKHPSTNTQPDRILETYLPSDISVPDLISRLKYSWFGSLRWLGHSESKDGIVLSWVTEDGVSKVSSRFKGRQLTIEIEPHDYALSNFAIKFAHELLARITKEYRNIVVQSPEKRPEPTLIAEAKHNIS
jgi:hypothetical protein